MRPPLPNGTILQDRYRILSVLGQGGFGRTYLAEDQGRFNELCAMKELSPTDVGGYVLEKSKELFLREGQTLYQIQHPQIPQFRATFEYEQRLFMVQDYVEGPTYRHLLDQRIAQGYTFSEAEVKQLLLQLLPVLAYIHSKGIIHRDITPDNIILRERDSLPVLIDFGVVKELATRFQAPGSVFPGTIDHSTTVGKVGYAPPEQMQTGRAYPSSDLYSLAVTAVVLLTGREPQELFDDVTLNWYWERWASVSPLFVQVINRMLSYRPGDRYQSATEVMQALQPPVPVPQAQPLAYPEAAYAQPGAYPTYQAPPSRAPTMAVDNPADANRLVERRPAPIAESRSSIWDDPLAVIAIGLGLVILTGIASWAIVRAVLLPDQNSPIASVTPTPIPTQTATPTPTTPPSPSPTRSPSPRPTEPVTYTRRLDVSGNTKVIQNGTLRANETINYIVNANQGEQLSALVSGDGVLMNVLGADQQPIGNDAQRVSYWQGTLPFSSDYYIQLRPVSGLRRSDYQLEVNLRRNPEPPPTPPYPPGPPGPPIETEQVQFAPGTMGTTISDRAYPNVIRRYLVNARRGQILQVRVNSGAVTLNIRYPGGRIFEDASNVLSWESELPRGGNYMIDVIAFQDTRFDLEINVRDLLYRSNTSGTDLSNDGVNRDRSYRSNNGRGLLDWLFHRHFDDDDRSSVEPDRSDRRRNYSYRHRRNSQQDSPQTQDNRDFGDRPRYRRPSWSNQEKPDLDNTSTNSDRPSSHPNRSEDDV